MALKNANRQPTTAAKRRQMFEAQNLKKVELYVPEHMKKVLKDYEFALRSGAAIRLLPPTDFTPQLSSKKGLDFMNDVSPWTPKTLFEELTNTDILPSDAVALELVDGVHPHLEITYLDLDRKAVMVVEGEQILISILICPVAEVSNPAAMNETLLKTHKVLPLSTIGICTLNGMDFYELFGALSSRSLLNSVALEIMALADNYEEVVSTFLSITETAA